MGAGAKQTVQHRASSIINVVHGQLEVIGCKSAYDTSDSNRKSLTTPRRNPAACVDYSVLSGMRFTNSTWTRGWGGRGESGRSVTPVTCYTLRYLKWIRSTARNVQVMRWIHGCVVFVTDAYKGTAGGQQHFTCFSRARFGLARTDWRLAYVLTFISRSHFLVRSTLHASRSIREFYLCPNARTVDTHEADLIPGNKKHT